jgi:hypothetical protein
VTATTTNEPITVLVMQNCLAQKNYPLPDPATIFIHPKRHLRRPAWNVALHWYDPSIPPSEDDQFFGNFAEDKAQQLAYRCLDKYDRVAGILGVLPATLMTVLRPEKCESGNTRKEYDRRTRALGQALRLTLLDGAHRIYSRWLRMQLDLDLEQRHDATGKCSGLPPHHERPVEYWWSDSVRRLVQ